MIPDGKSKANGASKAGVGPSPPPQWPEPEDTTTANSSYDDEHDPFIQRGSHRW